ncbi:NAD(P)H-dependent oxidoreductase [Burkholderiales bacterium]|nr:NAD(P)H-dependent oxidoreductase [Burkholderiales bacterium]
MTKTSISILGLSGSTRKGSFNTKLLTAALERAENVGARVTHLDLGSINLPFYDADLEVTSGLPGKVRDLKKQFEEADGLIIATPEYNGFFPGILKNCFDWLTRRTGPEDPILSAFNGKVAGLMSATVGGSGGIRALTSLTSQLHYLGVTVLPRPFSLTHAGKAFSDIQTLPVDSLSALDDMSVALLHALRKSD